MHRFLSAVVVASTLALLPRDVVAQPAPATPVAPNKAPALPKPAAPAKAPESASNPATPPRSAATAGADSQRRPDDRLSDEAELARVVGLYEAGKYRECSEHIERLLDPIGKAPLRQPAIVENARVYWAACLRPCALPFTKIRR